MTAMARAPYPHLLMGPLTAARPLDPEAVAAAVAPTPAAFHGSPPFVSAASSDRAGAPVLVTGANVAPVPSGRDR